MPRKAREPSPPEARRLVKTGRWSVGVVEGLALQVTGLARNWVPSLSIAGKQREMDLGSYPIVTPAGAREKARAFRLLIDRGGDPMAKRLAAISAAAAQRSTLKTCAYPVLGQLLLRYITPAHVIQANEPIWTTKPETAKRVRSLIELDLRGGSSTKNEQGYHVQNSRDFHRRVSWLLPLPMWRR